VGSCHDLGSRFVTTKVAVVTGAGQGIGKATALRFAAEGLHVVCADRNASAAERTVEYLGGRDQKATACTVDVSRDVDCQKVAEIAAGLGEVQVLCNIAGISPFSTGIAQVTEELWDRVFDVNVKSIFLMSRACLPHLVDCSENPVIVNMASVHAFAALPDSAPYAASKGAIVALTRQMAVDLSSSGVRVVAVAPGGVDTPSSYTGAIGLDTDSQELSLVKDPHRLGWLGDAKDVAEAVAWLASAQARFVNGATLVVDGGLLAQLPRSTSSRSKNSLSPTTYKD
jgi:NAD(P)-dependent dehydrogenase (short-subunit alcohol dehydrogenase family)